MTATETTTGGTIDAEVTVAYLQDIWSCAATGTVGTTVPTPTVVRDQTAATSTEGIVFTIALCQCRGVVDIGFAYLCLCGCSKTESRQNCM